MEFGDNMLVIKTDRECLFCKRSPNKDDRPFLHFFYKAPFFGAHYLCIVTSTFIQPGYRTKDHFFGFDFDAIGRTLEKTMRIYCVFCKKENASILCNDCDKPFHLPCGIKNNCVVEMFGSYIARCERCFLIKYRGKGLLSETLRKCLVCELCGENYTKDNKFVYRGNCCMRTNYHLDCLRKLAFTRGRKTRCPACRDKYGFQKDIRHLGVFVSTQVPTTEQLAMESQKY